MGRGGSCVGVGGFSLLQDTVFETLGPDSEGNNVSEADLAAAVRAVGEKERARPTPDTIIFGPEERGRP